jgi:hypothetical protein
VAPDPSELWTLEQLDERFDAWVKQEAPSTDLCVYVLDWVMSRMGDPYDGARRQPGFSNLWFAPIPDTEHDGKQATCTYWIEEATRRVRFDMFATLDLPIE